MNLDARVRFGLGMGSGLDFGMGFELHGKSMYALGTLAFWEFKVDCLGRLLGWEYFEFSFRVSCKGFLYAKLVSCQCSILFYFILSL